LVQANTLAGDAGTNINVNVKDASNEFSFTQPLHSGTINGNSFDASNALGLSYPNTNIGANEIFASQLNIFSPQPSSALVGLFQAFNTTTTSSVGVAFSQISIPPVISAMLEVYIVARDIASSDTSAWKYKAMIFGDGTGAYSGSLGLVQDFHDNTAGASTWDISSSFNSPASGDVRFYAIGENSKTINWSLYQTVTVVTGV